MQPVCFLYNPTAGETVITEWLDTIISIYQRRGCTIVPYRLGFRAGEPELIADLLGHGYRHVLVAGGDGTVNYVVGIMKHHGIDLPVAVLPTGTANDFAGMLGVPGDISRACRAILDGEEHYEPVVQLSTDRTPSINLVESENLGSHLRFSALAQNKTDRNMEPFFINVSYCPTGDLPSHHEGEEFLYVLEGSVQLLYGQETYTLEKGDSIYYDSIVTHNLTTLAEGETAKVLAVTYTPF